MVAPSPVWGDTPHSFGMEADEVIRATIGDGTGGGGGGFDFVFCPIPFLLVVRLCVMFLRATVGDNPTSSWNCNGL